jgi:LuxR family maltose regulon positive regulatory protein
MLALLAQRQRDDLNIERFATDFGGGHQHVIEYFVGEVLNAQPQDTQAFLLSTTFLNRLNGSLCDAVTDRTDSAAQLEHLERSNLFLQRLDTERGETWYRYHSLFAEAMRQVARQQLGQPALRALAARASAWQEAQGHLPEAIETALEAGAFERAATLIEQFFERRVYDEVYSQRRWLERLPQAVLFAHPTLCLAYASAVLFTEDRHALATRARIEPYLTQAEQAWRANGDAERLGELLAFRAVVAFWAGDFAANSALAREALALLPDSNALWRGVSLLHVVGEELRAGRVAELLPSALESRALCAAAGNLPAALAALTALGDISYWRAEFRQAAFYAEQGLEEARLSQTRLHYRSDEQMALTQLARIAFEQSDLVRADRLAEEAVELGVQADEPDGLKQASLLRLRIQHARGEMDESREATHDALREFIAAETSPALIREARVLQTRLALLDGDAAAAQRALASLSPSRSRVRLDEEREALLRAHVLLAQRKPDDVLGLVREWRADARANERVRSEIEWVAIEALAHVQRDDLPRSRLALADALKLAQPERVTRLFIEAGQPLVILLRDSLPHWRAAEIEPFARELLALMGESAADSTSAHPPTPSEPLSVQERRVLRLLAAGMTNAEIARELTVSVNTVKTQTQSIYRKLNVNGRDEARDAARRMKLI